MSVLFTNDVLVAIALGVIGAIVFSLIGWCPGLTRRPPSPR